MVTQSKWLSGNGSFFGVGLDELDVARHAEVQQAVATDLEHGSVDVSQNHLPGRTDQVGKFASQITRAASDVEHAVAGAHAGQLNGETLPQAVHATGQQVVHEVVLGRDRMENLSDFFCLLAFRYIFVTEVSRRFGIAAFALIVHIASPE